ncbi:MAG: putative Ig domain-containing protein [Acidimicrobiales bacterium]
MGDIATPTNMKIDTAGSSTSPATLIPDSDTYDGDPTEWEIGATDVENDQQLVFVNEYQVISTGDLSYDGTSGLAVFSLPTTGLPTLLSVISLPTEDTTNTTTGRNEPTMWGNAMTHDATYSYIYGAQNTVDHQPDAGWMEVARVPLDETATVSDWQYWNGTTWVSDENDAVATTNSQLFTGVALQLSGGGYESVQLANSESAPEIDVGYACDPWGPWSSSAEVYTPPETTQYAPDEIAYTPTFHPDLSSSDGLVISYSIDNTGTLSDLEQDVHEYQPRFIVLGSGAPAAPVLTSAADDITPTGSSFTYLVTTSGSPTPAITLAPGSSLPTGVSLTDNGNGTATLAGTSSVASGVYTFTIQAANGTNPDASQVFTLTVTGPPVFTSAASDTVPFGSPFSYTVTTMGGPTPAITLAPGSSLPTGVSVTDNGNGTATLAGTSSVASGVYTFTIQAANGLSPNATQSFTLTVNAPGPYSPLSPVRICDTRVGNPSNLSGEAAQCNGGADNPGSPLSAGGTKTVNVAGFFGIPSDATAVVLNVTAADPAGSGHLIVYPTGAGLPTASNLNYTAGATTPNLVEVGTGTDGDVSIYSLAQSDLVVDVEGYVAATAIDGPGSGLYDALSSPTRICDTRAGNPSGLRGSAAQCNGGAGNPGERLAAGGTLSVQVSGTYGGDVIPAGATAAVLNVTSVGSSGPGHLTVYPQGSALPTASNVNYPAGQTTANRVIVPLSASGQISITSSAASDVLVDISGYFTEAEGTGTRFSAETAPERICDTRPGNPSGLSGSAAQCNGAGDTGDPLGAGSTLTIQVTGLAGVPADATAAVVNLTGVGPSAQTHLTVYPAPPLPTTSDLNIGPGQTRANLTIATLSPSGTISIYNNSGSTNVAVDVLGWYS